MDQIPVTSPFAPEIIISPEIDAKIKKIDLSIGDVFKNVAKNFCTLGRYQKHLNRELKKSLNQDNIDKAAVLIKLGADISIKREDFRQLARGEHYASIKLLFSQIDQKHGTNTETEFINLFKSTDIDVAKKVKLLKIYEDCLPFKDQNKLYERPDLFDIFNEVIRTKNTEAGLLFLDHGISMDRLKSENGTHLAFKLIQPDLSLETVKFWVEGLGLNVNAVYSGLTLLMIAVYNDKPGIVSYLIDKGADLNILFATTPFAEAETVLHQAVGKGNVPIIGKLLEGGADYRKDKTGPGYNVNALQAALNSGNLKIVETFETYAKNLNDEEKEAVKAYKTFREAFDKLQTPSSSEKNPFV